MQIVNSKTFSQVAANSLSSDITKMTKESSVAPRNYVVPPVNSDVRNSIQNSLDVLVMVQNQEDSDVAAFLADSEVELSAPAKTRTRAEYNVLINNVINKLLAEKGNGQDFLRNALETLSSTVSAYNKQIKDTLDNLQKELNVAEAEMNSAADEMNTLEEQSVKYKSIIDGLQAKLSQLKESGVTSDMPEYQAVEVEIRSAEDALLKLSQPLSQAIDTLKQKIEVVNDIQNKMSSVITVALSDTKNAKILDMNFIEQRADEQVKLSLRILQIVQQNIKDRLEEVTKRAEDELKRTQFNVEMIGKERVKQAEKAEKEYEKAQEAAKKSDCISKIISYVVAAVGMAITVATGGLASPLSAIMIGLSVADLAVSAATGTSFIGKALEPLMNHVLMPIIEAIGKAVDWLFQNTPLGLLLKQLLPEDAFDTVRNAIKMASTIAAIVLAGYLLKNAGSFMSKSALGKAVINAVMKQATKMMSAVSRNIPGILKNTGEFVSASFKKISDKIAVPNKIQKYATVAEAVKDGANAANTIQNEAFKINQARTFKLTTDARLDVEALQFVREKQDELTDMMQESLKVLQDFIQNLTRMNQQIILDRMKLGQRLLLPLKV